MAMVQWLRRHGHFRGKASKAFLADLPRLMEALLQAPAEALGLVLMYPRGLGEYMISEHRSWRRPGSAMLRT